MRERGSWDKNQGLCFTQLCHYDVSHKDSYLIRYLLRNICIGSATVERVPKGKAREGQGEMAQDGEMMEVEQEVPMQKQVNCAYLSMFIVCDGGC